MAKVWSFLIQWEAIEEPVLGRVLGRLVWIPMHLFTSASSQPLPQLGFLTLVQALRASTEAQRWHSP